MDINKKLVTLMTLLSETRVNTLTHLIVTNTFVIEKECSVIFDEV